MANSYFGFNSIAKSRLHKKNPDSVSRDDVDGCENEEDYDALNDETFGPSSNLDDWEEQHEQFAEINEISRITNEKLEHSISGIELDNSSSEDESTRDLLTYQNDSYVWNYAASKNNACNYGNSDILASLHTASKSFIEAQTNTRVPHFNNPLDRCDRPTALGYSPSPGNICTVEELERSFLQNSDVQVFPSVGTERSYQARVPNKPVMDKAHINEVSISTQGQRICQPLLHPRPQLYQHLLQLPSAPPPPPPGMPPLNIPPPRLRLLPPNFTKHPGMITPEMRMIPTMMMPSNNSPKQHGYAYSLSASMVTSPFNLPPLPPQDMVASVARTIKSGQNHHGQHQYSPQQKQLHYSNQRSKNVDTNCRQFDEEEDRKDCKDEYAGLMTAKDKQWLMNIQMIQLNTGTPYFDDYYYTIYKERNSRNMAYNDSSCRMTNSGRQRKGSDRQDTNNLMHRIYTPLQFENSLGKLQCGSVTAPRKIIDMDIVYPEKEQDIPIAKDSRKIKQYLLELESLYSVLLKAEDLTNPVFQQNMEKWREIRQKQRLRELEQAPTPEQKQEVLRLFKLESEPVVEHQFDYITRICSGMLQDDRFSSFLNIRKGKMLLLRLLPYLSLDNFSSQLLEIWSRVLLSLPVTGRRDTAGDNILPKLYPYFNRYVQHCTISDIIDIISGLVEVAKQENNRSTPLSHVGKAPLYFVVLNKFGVSAMICLLIRVERIMATVDLTEKQEKQWSEFLQAWAEHSNSVSRVAIPMEAIPSDVFRSHVEKFPQLSAVGRTTLDKYYVDVNIIT